MVGIFGCAICLGFWVDLRQNGNIDLSPGDPNWVGAWWLPFFVDALLGFVLFAFAFGFPNQFPGVSLLKEERHRNNTVYQTTVKSSRSWLVKIQKVFFNPIWLLCTIAGFGDSFLVSALMGYGMKFIQEQYAVSATVAGIAGGLCAFGGLLGVLFPMIPIRVLKWEGWKCLAACSISSIALFVIYLPAVFLLPCGNSEFFGIFDGNGDPGQSMSLDQSCNMGCGCSVNTYAPVCNVEKKITFFSPCHAGWTKTPRIPRLPCILKDVSLLQMTLFWSVAVLRTFRLQMGNAKTSVQPSFPSPSASSSSFCCFTCRSRLSRLPFYERLIRKTSPFRWLYRPRMFLFNRH